MLRVANYHNQPFGGRATRGSWVHLPREEGTWSRHQHLFEENIRKTGTCGLRTLIVKGLGVFFTHGEGISTPRVRHKGRQPLIKCANITSNYFIFPFFTPFMSSYAFLVFPTFSSNKHWWRLRAFSFRGTRIPRVTRRSPAEG